MIQIRFHILIAFTYPCNPGEQTTVETAVEDALFVVAGDDLEVFTDIGPGRTHLIVEPMQSLAIAEQVEADLRATLVKHGCTILEGAC